MCYVILKTDFYKRWRGEASSAELHAAAAAAWRSPAAAPGLLLFDHYIVGNCTASPAVAYLN